MKIRFGRLKNQFLTHRKKRIQRLQKLHPWFAWYPVKVNDEDWRFLEKVYRRNLMDTCTIFVYMSKEQYHGHESSGSSIKYKNQRTKLW